MLAARSARPAAAAARAAGRLLSTPASATVTADVPRYVVEAPEPEITTLDNGVTVASMFTEGSLSPRYVVAEVSSLGSRFDRVGGESALLAHSLGGCAGREHISLPSLAPLALKGDLSALKAERAAKVRGNSIESQVMDHLHQTAFQTSAAGDSLGSFLEGTPDSVMAIEAGDVEELAGKVRGADVVVVGTGAGEHGRLVEEAEAAYGGLAGGKGELALKREKSAFIGSDVRIKYDSHSTATLAIAYDGASWLDPKAMSLELLAAILGSYETSAGLGKNVAPAMCAEVAEHGLASSISAFSLSYSDAGLFGFLATAPDKKLDDLLWYVLPTIAKASHGVSDEELARAKAALRTKVLCSYDGDIAAGENLARQLRTTGRYTTVAEAAARAEALDGEDVKEAAGVVYDQDHALAAIGALHELPDYNWIRRHSYLLRY